MFRLRRLHGAARRPHLLLQGRRCALRPAPRRDAQTQMCRLRRGTAAAAVLTGRVADILITLREHVEFLICTVMCGSVAEWLGSQTCDQRVAGSNPGRRTAQCNPGQIVYTLVPLSPSSIIWYKSMGWGGNRGRGGN